MYKFRCTSLPVLVQRTFTMSSVDLYATTGGVGDYNALLLVNKWNSQAHGSAPVKHIYTYEGQS